MNKLSDVFIGKPLDNYTNSPIDISVDVQNVVEHLFLRHLRCQRQSRQSLSVRDSRLSTELVGHVEHVLKQKGFEIG